MHSFSYESLDFKTNCISAFYILDYIGVYYFCLLEMIIIKKVFFEKFCKVKKMTWGGSVDGEKEVSGSGLEQLSCLTYMCIDFFTSRP